MASMKVSILNTRRHIPELNCMSPIYAREIPNEKLVTIIRAGFVVVDAADLQPIGLDNNGTTPKKITKAAPAPHSNPASGPAAASPSSPAGGSPVSGGGGGHA